MKAQLATVNAAPRQQHLNQRQLNPKTPPIPFSKNNFHETKTTNHHSFFKKRIQKSERRAQLFAFPSVDSPTHA
jgi:hypothetical protein